MKHFIAVICIIITLAASPAFADQTRLQMRAAVRVLINETDSTNSNFTDTQINDALNYSLDLLCDVLPESAQYKMFQVDVGAATTSSETVTLPAGFKKVISVELYGKPAIPIKLEQWYLKRNYATAIDPHYAIINTNLFLLPANTSATNPYKLLYLKKPTLMTSDVSTIIS
ncbi:MAG: hypothetical protein EOM87_10295, partial [Clostridia bacterium]|nr:hypothetical protein [Clostridia bacterium]